MTSETQPDREAAQQELLKSLKAYIDARSRLGPNVSGAQVEEYIEDEKRSRVRRAHRQKDSENATVLAKKREEEIRQGARELVSSGRILCTVEGVRIPAVGDDLNLPCPHCGTPLPGTAEPITRFASAWITCPPDQRFSQYSPVLTNPNSPNSGAPLFFYTFSCPSCHSSARIAVQLVVL